MRVLLAGLMSDLALPERKLVDPPTRDGWLAWTVLASLLGHAALLALTLWAPLREVAEPAPPQAIDVELVEPAAQPPPQEAPDASAETGREEAPEETAPEEPTEAAPASPAAPEETVAPPPPASPGANPDTSAQNPPAAAAAGAPPVPLPRPRTATTGTSSAASNEPVPALSAEPGDAEGTRPDALSAGPGIEILELGELRQADRFYLAAMLQQPGLARARDMLPTLPRDKRLAQTCNIEALAQIGNSGDGFAPDVVMADAYAPSVLTGTGLSATGAVFRSRERWYGLAFDCTLSDDLTQVTAFTYRLGADVTDAVLARLQQR